MTILFRKVRPGNLKALKVAKGSVIVSVEPIGAPLQLKEWWVDVKMGDCLWSL